MSLIELIFKNWREKPDSSTSWSLAKKPSGSIEALIFGNDPHALMKSGSEGRETLFNINYYQDIKQKKRYARFTYFLTAVWVFVLFLVILLQGLGGRGAVALEVFGYRTWYQNFHLSENEFIAFITSTTATIIGLSYLVGRYLFTTKKDDYSDQSAGIMLRALNDAATGKTPSVSDCAPTSPMTGSPPPPLPASVPVPSDNSATGK